MTFEKIPTPGEVANSIHLR